MNGSLKFGWLVALLVLSSCGPDLGACDPDEARRVVYDSDGTPAFEGQGMMIQSCGWGAFCHADSIPLENRRGVPLGLEYDVSLASFGGDTAPEEAERLRAMQRQAFEHRHAIWEQVSTGAMPIVHADVVEGAPVYTRLNVRSGTRTPSPELSTPEGREALRNWLACGLPVVERTEAPTDGADPIEPVGYVVASQEVEPLLPEWNDIYTRLVERRCNSAPCHGDSAAGNLDLRGGPDAALATLLAGTAADAEACMVEAPGTPLLAAGDPEGSLFFQKLSGRDAAGDPVCGRVMPIGGARVSEASLASIRQWITDLP